MAADCLAVLDELKWDSAHVMGHSLGGMIAAKVRGARRSAISLPSFHPSVLNPTV